jgi:hypothetical protein
VYVTADLDRVISEDEIARAGVERAAAAVRERVEAERARIAGERPARLRLLAEKVDEAVARILADADRDVAARRAHRERLMNEHVARGEHILEGAAGAFAGIIRDGPRKKTL